MRVLRNPLLRVLGIMLVMTVPVQAAVEEYPFESEEQKQQFKKLTADLRCPKCLNSNLAGSDAPIAQDITNEIYRQISAGRSNDEIIDFMVSRYGDFITYKPPLNASTFLLWFGPLFILLGGFFFIWWTAKNNRVDESALSSEEQAKLQEILSKEQK